MIRLLVSFRVCSLFDVVRCWLSFVGCVCRCLVVVVVRRSLVFVVVCYLYLFGLRCRCLSWFVVFLVVGCLLFDVGVIRCWFFVAYCCVFSMCWCFCLSVLPFGVLCCLMFVVVCGALLFVV